MLARHLTTPLAGLVLGLPLVALAPADATGATDAAAPARPAPAPPAKVTSLDVPVLPQAERRAITVETPGAAADTLPRLAAVAPRATRDFGLVGVTWRRGTGQEDVRVQVRTRSGDDWSGWSDLEVDPQSTGEDGTRAGTEPLWAGDADGVAVRVLAAPGRAPQDVRTVLVDPGATPAAAPQASGTAQQQSQQAQVSPAAVTPPAYTARPSIISRAAWGARANTACDEPRFGSTQLGIVFHHTAGSNSYTKAQSAGIVRSIQSYHMSGRGWCDIGYNFLVDKYGQIFEGRSGGELYQVRGAHAGNSTVNTYTTGVSMMGNLDTAAPPAAMRYATTRLVGWRVGTFYIPATGSYSIAGKVLPRIAGHRDVYRAGIRPATSTACPGRYGYSYLNGSGGLRDSVATYTSRYRTAIKVKAGQLGRAYTGNVFVGEYPLTGGWKTRFGNGDIVYKPGLSPRWMPKGPFVDEYAALGSTAGALGFPMGDVVTVGSKAYQRFEGGTIWRVSASRAIGLTGPVDYKYRTTRSVLGPLGDPTSRVVRSGDLDSATFTGGRITYNRVTKAYTVTYS